jgi:putative transposase
MCRVLDVSASGYYAWVKRPPSMRAETDAALTAKIHAAHVASNGTYGAPRLQIDLAEAGIRVGRKRVARLMRNAGLVGVSRRKSTITTVRDGARQAPDLVDRNFTADRPNLLWVADITYIPTWAGFLYLAVVLDAFSRRIVGWSMATTLHTQLVLDALKMALWQRRPNSVIHHSDKARSILRSSSANAVARQAFAPRWVRSETPTTTRWPRASSPHSNVSYLIGVASRRTLKRAWPSSNSSKASTIHAVGIHHLGIYHLSHSSVTLRR